MRWKSGTSTSFRIALGNQLFESKIIQNIGGLDTRELICLTNTLDSGRWDGDEYQRNFFILQIASLSIHWFFVKEKNHAAVGENVIEVWCIESDLLKIVNNLFDELREDLAEHKKLALDLGFVIASRMLNFTNNKSCFGLCAPLRKYHHQLLMITLKLLESFMVTTPPHFPFMPAEHFAGIRWPVAVQESCSGKVHSIITFLPTKPAMPIMGTSGAADACFTEEETSKEEDVKYCNFEVVARRQPWKGMISVLHLYQLAQLLIDCRTAASTDAAYSRKDSSTAIATTSTSANEQQAATVLECEEVLHVLRNCFRRIASVDPALICRDSVALSSTALPGLCCCGAPPYTIPTHASFNPYAALSRNINQQQMSTAPAVRNQDSSDGALLRARCRVCGSAICAACAASETWMNDRVCTTCYPLIQELGLQQVKEKKPKKCVSTVEELPVGDVEAGTNGEVDCLAPSERQLMFAPPTVDAIGRMGHTIGSSVRSVRTMCTAAAAACEGTGKEGEDEEEAGVEDGRDSPCCSVSMPDSLRSWRDGGCTVISSTDTDTDDEGGPAE